MSSETIDYFFSLESYRKMPGGDWPILVNSYSNEETLGGLHYHDFFELAVITGGHGVYCDSDGHNYQLVPGNVFLLCPGMQHRYIEQSNLKVTNILWIENELRMELFDLPQSPGYHALFELEPKNRGKEQINRSLILNTEQLTEVEEILRRLKHELTMRPPGARLAATSLAGLLFTTLCRAYADVSKHSDRVLFQLDKVIAYIHRHYQQPLRRAQLAKMAAMSEPTFYRAFYKMLGISPAEYILDLRLKHAEELLRNTTVSLTEIALQTGFTDSNYFGLVFKRRYGIPPHRYRRQLQNDGIALPDPVENLR